MPDVEEGDIDVSSLLHEDYARQLQDRDNATYQGDESLVVSDRNVTRTTCMCGIQCSQPIATSGLFSHVLVCISYRCTFIHYQLLYASGAGDVVRVASMLNSGADLETVDIVCYYSHSVVS